MITARRSTSPRALALRTAAVLAGSALMFVGAQISVPMWPVPITGQTLALPIVVALLGRNLGTLAIFAYLAEGGLGLPVFGGHTGGAARLVGPTATTAGYLWSFPVAAFALGWLLDHGFAGTYALRFAAIFATSAIVFALGAWWLAVVLHLSTAQALALGVTPFLIGDIAKCAIAAGIGPQWQRIPAVLGI